MNAKEEIKKHRLPCGPMTIAIDGVCRRRLRDSMDRLLDRLTQETHPEGRDPEQEHDLDVANHEDAAMEQQPEPEESREEKKQRMLEDGKLKLEVKKELQDHEKQLFPDKFENKTKQESKEEKPSREERKKDLIQEGKLKNEVKKAVQRHADSIMPKTSNHAENLQGNSKMLQDPSGKIKKR